MMIGARLLRIAALDGSAVNHARSLEDTNPKASGRRSPHALARVFCSGDRAGQGLIAWTLPEADVWRVERAERRCRLQNNFENRRSSFRGRAKSEPRTGTGLNTVRSEARHRRREREREVTSSLCVTSPSGVAYCTSP